jgi:glycosyltransferase involved in cell wall biosynthesis
MKELQAEQPNLETVIFERMPHIGCLKRKRSCHIVFDHMCGWFGISSLESLSHGKPVIAGLDDWNIKCIKKFTGSDRLPWVVARDEEGLQYVLRELIANRDMRKAIGRQSRDFIEQHWTEQRALHVLFDVYGDL